MDRPETIVDQSRKLLGVIIQYAEKMPRNHKFTIGDRLISRSISLLESVVEAYYTGGDDKRQHIKRANVHLEILRQLIRFCHESKMHVLSKHEHFTKEIDALGKNIGGWGKSVASRDHA